jgi:hypothetical protein
VGAWRFDDIYEPTRMESAMPGKGLEEIDGAGFYCYLTPREYYTSHEYKPYDNAQMGPDLNYSMWLRRQGNQNYIDWDVQMGHIDAKGKTLTLSNTPPQRVIMKRINHQWRFRND